MINLGGAVDVHTHCYPDMGFNEEMIRLSRMLGIEQLWVSYHPYAMTGFKPPSEEVWKANEFVYELSRKFKEVKGFVYVNPLNHDAVKMTEFFIKERGFIGVKLYRAVRVSRRIVDPIIEVAVENNVPILVHTAHRLYPTSRPNESEPEDIRSLALRFPKAKIIMAHITGGGDWEYAVSRVRDLLNVYVDIGGSVADYGSVEEAVRVLGDDRVLFATDTLISAAVARIMSANISEESRIKILKLNAMRILGEQ
ncbi:amidohydrolase family protein [Caldivirga sp. UBA161]|uniref:amidohydrolase family protein n=1 Tax=Caldivirga sp. UBA161 TaxID=1915569 RepID=UPI0025C27D62|nr:amidohydrolase family protein [Caldivirga sp. UBA161]